MLYGNFGASLQLLTSDQGDVEVKAGVNDLLDIPEGNAAHRNRWH
jgi:hypothetical protein